MTKLTISYRRSFVSITVLMSFSLFSLATPSDNGLPSSGFPRRFQISCVDTVPQKQKSKDNAADRENASSSVFANQSIENAIREVELSMQRLKRELRNVPNEATSFYNKSMDNIYRRKTAKVSKRVLMEAQARLNYFDLGKAIALENQLRMADINRSLGVKKIALERNRKNVEIAMAYNHDIGMQKAKWRLREANGKLKRINDFKEDLVKDGIIKKDEPYNIEIKDGKLYINDKKQPAKVYKKYKEKYSEYFEEKNNFKIKHDGNKQRKFDDGGLI